MWRNVNACIIACLCLVLGPSQAWAFLTPDPPRKWGDPTLGAGAEVTYSFGLGMEQITEGGEVIQMVPLDTIFPPGYELEIERALIIWAAEGNLDFRRQANGLYGGDVDIGIGAHPRADGDNYLAHAGYPLAGDAHFASNVNQNWSFDEADPGPHILTTAVHEFGHSLGLAHAGPDKQGISVMQGGGLVTNGFHQTVWQDDIDAMHYLYGAAIGDTWDPGFNNLVGNWNDDYRWFHNAQPDESVPVSIFNGNVLVTQPGEQAASLRLGGMSSGLVRVQGAGQLAVAGDTSIRSGGNFAMLGGRFATANLDMSQGGVLTQRVGATPYPSVEVTETAALDGGQLVVSPASGYALAAGDLFSVVQAGSITGTFSSVDVPLDDPNLVATIQYTGTKADLFVYRPGDLDFDGLVTASDWEQFISHLFTDTSGLPANEAYGRGDLDLSGGVDEFDFMSFKQAFVAANGRGSFAALGTAIPEPSGAGLAAAIGALLAIVGRRRGAAAWLH